jgi:cobalt-zinc-cadmium efflux system outer membrane protein
MLGFQNGEIGLPQLLIVQRQTIDAQRDVVEAERDLRLTQIELEYAAGWPVTFPTVNKE